MLLVFKSIELAQAKVSTKRQAKNEFEGNKICPVGTGFHDASPNFILSILHHLNNQLRPLCLIDSP